MGCVQLQASVALSSGSDWHIAERVCGWRRRMGMGCACTLLHTHIAPGVHCVRRAGRVERGDGLACACAPLLRRREACGYDIPGRGNGGRGWISSGAACVRGRAPLVHVSRTRAQADVVASVGICAVSRCTWSADGPCVRIEAACADRGPCVRVCGYDHGVPIQGRAAAGRACVCTD
ncbi:hypothetical protein B0H13DRAFT_1963731, partial [Mycena leptocephala]